jgi:hypothetical protein
VPSPIPDGSSRYLLRPPSDASVCNIFLSSGGDVIAERDRFEEIAKVFSEQLHFEMSYRSGGYVHVVRWEQDAPKRTGGDPNAEFRRQAELAHLTVVLLHNDVRTGTKEELEAALAVDDVQLAVIWMKPVNPRKRATLALRRFLQERSHLFIWDQTGPPGSDEAWLSMTRVIARVVISAVASRQAQAEEVFYEER